MIIGFLGKGGSGKSTLSTAMIRFLAQKDKSVAAIDADHNMDLIWNLYGSDAIPYFGESMQEMREILGITDEHYREVFFRAEEPEFKLSPQPDAFTEKFSKVISTPTGNTIRLFAAGPHTEAVLHGEHCSHSLATPLKIYLPFLKLQENEHVIVDEKASRDAAGTGIPSGFSFAFITTEATPHGFKAARQIAEILNRYQTPYAYVVNKVTNENHKWLKENAKKFLDKSPILAIPLTNTPDELFPFMEKLHAYANEHIKTHGDTRKERSRQKFLNHKNFAEKNG